MPSRRILSNNNLAPIQEVAVNPYNSFNSDSVNKLTRIVSGGKGHDVVVDGLDVSSNDKTNWIDSSNLLSDIVEGNNNQFDASCGWTGSGYYVGKFDGGLTTYVDLYIDHQNSYGFSWISCKLNDEWLQSYYGKDDGTGQSIERDFEITFDLNFGTPKSIVAEINSSRTVLDHPESGKSYSLRITRNFLKDTKQDGLVFRIGAVLDGADPLAGIVDNYDPEGHIEHTITNKTYIRICNIQAKVYGYSREPFSRSIGPANGVRGLSAIYGLAGIHPVKTLKVTPGLAIKDDAMLEELGLTRYDKDTVVELNPTEESSWIKGNPYTKNDFGTGNQYVFQLNNVNSGYTRHSAHFDSTGHLKVTINGSDYNLIDDYQISDGDSTITFNDIGNGLDDSKFDEDNNLYLCCTGNLIAGSICLVTYKGIVVERKVISQEESDNNKFVVILHSNKITTKLKSLSDVRGYISFGPLKVSGDPQLYNSDLVKWAYVVIYYSYFKHPIPNVSYIGLVREEDINDIKFREDYLILAKVRFVDFETIDIISYENRQRKWLPRSDKINYSTTCNFPEIWYDEVPDTVTDAIDYLAKFNVNLARLIRYKHDYDAEISSAFNLVTKHEITSGSDKDKKPFISINDYSHLERRIRVNTNKLIVNTVFSEGYNGLENKVFVWDNSKKVYLNNELKWAVTFEKSVIDNSQGYEYFNLGGEVLVKATMGPYDASTSTITNKYICFNTIGPFKFINKETGNDTVKLDWEYGDILLYPTSPSMNKTDGVYTDSDDGGWTTGYYGGTHTSSGNYLLSYTTVDGSKITEINSDKNHFHFIKFRNQILTIDRFLKLLDMMPRNPEVLFDKRTLEGQKSNIENDQVHIQSSQHQLDDDMVDYNLTMSVRDNTKPKSIDIDGNEVTASTVTNHIKSSKFTIAGLDPADGELPEKCEDKDDPQYGTFNNDLKDTALLTSFDISNNSDKSRIKIKSTDMHLAASGNNEILVSNYNPTTKLFDIVSSGYTIGDFYKYWFKPKFSYDINNKKLRIIIDASKRYITRVSDIIYEFNKETEETTVNITSVKATPYRIIYSYNGNSVKNGMIVYTNGNAISPYYCNTIDDNNHFAKIETSNGLSTVQVFNTEYYPVNKDYSDNPVYLYINPVYTSQLFFNIKSVTKNDDTIVITVLNSTSNVDDFKIKEGMGVYTEGLDHNIFKYNNYIVQSVEDYIENDAVVGKIVSVKIDSNYSGGDSVPVKTSDDSKIYFICDDEHYGIQPYFNVNSVISISQGNVTFNVSGQKYTSQVNVGDKVYVTTNNEKFNISEESEAAVVSVEEVINETANESETHVTISGYPEIEGESLPVSLNGTIYVKEPVAGITTEHSTRLLNSRITDIYKVSNNTLRVKLVNISKSNEDYPYIASNEIKNYTIATSFNLEDVNYDSNRTDGVIVSSSYFSVDKKVINIVENSKKSVIYSSDPEDESATVYANYAEVDITFDNDIDNSYLVKIDDVYYAYKYNFAHVRQESMVSATFSIRYQISKVENGCYFINGVIDSILNDTIVYTDNLGEPRQYNDEINVNNPQIVTVEDDHPGEFYIERDNGYDSTFSDSEFVATAKNITLKEIVSTQSTDSKSRIDADVIIDISSVKDIDVTESTIDSYKTLERYFKSKLVVINDLVDKIDSDTNLPVKPFITLSFSVVDEDGVIEDNDYFENPSKIIWKDEYRGYNNTKEEDEEFSKMILYPAQVASNAEGAQGSLVNIVNEFEANGSQVSTLSGYGSYRGPIYTINAGVRSEFDFQYLKTPSRIVTGDDDKIYIADDDKNLIDIQEIDIDTNLKLTDVLSFHDIPDIIFAKASMYYISNTESSGSDSTSITIGYDPNGGSINGKTTTQYKIVNNPQIGVTDYPEISDPVSNKRTFIGWVYDNETIVIGTTKLKKASSHILTAEWTTDILNVTFKDTNDGSDKIPDVTYSMPFINSSNTWNTLSKLEQNGSIVGFPSWERSGYSLIWSYDQFGNNVATLQDTYNSNGYLPFVKDNTLTIYAVWSVATLTVTMDPNGGTWDDNTSIIKERSYNFGDLYGRLPRNLIKIGYDFEGWQNTATGLLVYDSDNVGSTSHTIKAQWTPKTYTITWNSQGGDSVSNWTGRQYNSQLGTLPAPSRTGYTLNGWYTEPTGGTQISSDTVVTGDSVYYAQWTPKTYTITWNSQGGTEVSSWTSIEYDSTLGTLPAPIRVGYSLDGWYTEPTGGTQISGGTIVTDNKTYYAHWSAKILVTTFFKNNTECSQPDPNAQLIKFESTYGTSVSDDGRFGNIPSIYGTSWNSGELPVLENFNTDSAKYSFDGWALRPEGTNKVTNSTIVSIPFSHPLFATWVFTPFEEPEDSTPPPEPSGEWVATGKNRIVYGLYLSGYGSLRHTFDGDPTNCNTYETNNSTKTYTNIAYPGKTFYLVKILPGRDMTESSKYIYGDLAIWQYKNHKFEYWWLINSVGWNDSIIESKQNALEDPIVPYYNSPVQSSDNLEDYVVTYAYIDTELLQTYVRNGYTRTGFVFAPSYTPVP